MKVASTMIQEPFLQKAGRFLRYYEISGLACGMIFTRLQRGSEQDLLAMKEFVARADPQVAIQHVWEDSSGAVAILLDGQSLADTHYLALTVKDFFQGRNLLAGDLLVCGLPEAQESLDVLLPAVWEKLHRQHESENWQIRIFHPYLARSQRPVLVVDHDRNVRELLQARFSAKGFEVYTAQDGLEALELFEQVQPQLVITELSLPILDGYQLIAGIQERGDSDCRILVLTERRLEEDISKCFEWGLADYLTKPFSPIELDVRVKRFLSDRHGWQ